MGQVLVATPLNINLEFNIAPFYKRLLAWLIDIVIYIIYIKIVGLLFGSLFNRLEDDSSANAHWFGLIIGLPISVYPFVCEFFFKGQTVGKKLLKIKVINATGGSATFSQCVLRSLIRFTDFYLVIILIILVIFYSSFGKPNWSIFFLLFIFSALSIVDFFCLIIHKKGQRLGDIAANTILIDTKTKYVLNETVFVDVEDNYQVRYPEVMRLSDRDLNNIRNIQNNLMRNYNVHLAYNTANKIKSVLKIESSQEPISFIETVLKDYNFLSTR